MIAEYRLAIVFEQQCDGTVKVPPITGDVAGAQNTVNTPGLEKRQCFRHWFGSRVDIAE